MSCSTKSEAPDRIEIELRVRYSECDPMRVAHHSVYSIWMEMARTEMLRRRGRAYERLESDGICFVVARLSLRFRKPARYDDLLRVSAEALPATGIKVDHLYTIFRGDELLAEGRSTLVCVNRAGRPQPIPEGVVG